MVIRSVLQIVADHADVAELAEPELTPDGAVEAYADLFTFSVCLSEVLQGAYLSGGNSAETCRPASFFLGWRSLSLSEFPPRLVPRALDVLITRSLEDFGHFLLRGSE